MNCKIKSNINLIVTYQAVLFREQATSEKLTKLANLENFPAAGFRVPGAEVTNENHSQSDAIFDFVYNVAPEIELEKLDDILTILLKEEAKNNPTTFLRNACLAKHLLAYQLANNPDQAAAHFRTDEYISSVKDQGGVAEFNKLIIQPLAEQFKTGSFDAVADTSAEEERIYKLNAQQAQRKADVREDTKESASLPISFFMVMSHPAAKITSAALLVVGLAALATAGAALYGVTAVAGYATTNGLSAASTLSLLGVLGLMSGAQAAKGESADDLVRSSPLPK